MACLSPATELLHHLPPDCHLLPHSVCFVSPVSQTEHTAHLCTQRCPWSGFHTGT